MIQSVKLTMVGGPVPRVKLQAGDEEIDLTAVFAGCDIGIAPDGRTAIQLHLTGEVEFDGWDVQHVMVAGEDPTAEYEAKDWDEVIISGGYRGTPGTMIAKHIAEMRASGG